MKSVLIVIILFFSLYCNEMKPPLFPKGVSSVETGWEGKRSLSSKECQSCHNQTHLEWKDGMHAKAWTDPLFQNAFKIERQEWCVNCHAPLSEQKKEFLDNSNSDKSLLAEGINCASCHVREGKVLGFQNFKNDFHEVIKFDSLSTSEFCENCHQFNFPRFEKNKIHYSNEPMQNTYSEWKNSNSSRTCQDCHYDGHRLLGNHNPERLEKDFSEIEYEFFEKGLLHISLRLKNNRAHILPTGDLFHSIQLEIATDPEYKHFHYRKKWARIYGIGNIGGNTFWNRKLIRNTGLTPNEELISLTIDAPNSNKPLYARLVYYFHDEELGGRNDLPSKEKMYVIREKILRFSK
ncbi:MAG TPA: multiheme c-type cytochrome [Leptospiraceae bacterium]|nr:multiheme c-type cytochrome [Leptospiraceae bacterium]